MLRAIILIAGVLLIANAAAAEKPINLSTGVWQVVKLEPKDDNPIQNENWYLIFLDNGLVVNVYAPYDKQRQARTEINEYYISENKLVLSGPNREPSIHSVKEDGGLIRLSVPFGEMWLKFSPNHPIKPTR